MYFMTFREIFRAKKSHEISLTQKSDLTAHRPIVASSVLYVNIYEFFCGSQIVVKKFLTC